MICHIAAGFWRLHYVDHLQQTLLIVCPSKLKCTASTNILFGALMSLLRALWGECRSDTIKHEATPPRRHDYSAWYRGFCIVV